MDGAGILFEQQQIGERPADVDAQATRHVRPRSPLPAGAAHPWPAPPSSVSEIFFLTRRREADIMRSAG
jgi:hypothetical protein